jgi:hypothetical protein
LLKLPDSSVKYYWRLNLRGLFLALANVQAVFVLKQLRKNEHSNYLNSANIGGLKFLAGTVDHPATTSRQGYETQSQQAMILRHYGTRKFLHG